MLSNELVASSKISIFEFFNNSLIIVILCRWPPEIFIPPSPSIELYPLSKLFM